LFLVVFFIVSISLQSIFSDVASSSGKTWSGTVYDIRTGMPMAGVDVKAGTLGRVDPFKNYHAVTDSQGKFSITWDNESWRLRNADRCNHYLRINCDKAYPNNHSYFPLTLIRKQPTTNNSIYLTPKGAFFKGQLLSAETGAPLQDVKVSLRAPARVFESVTTDRNGYFSFKPVQAYAKPPSQLFDVYPTTLSDEQPRDPGKHQSYCMGLNTSEFEDIMPEKKGTEFAVSLPLQSSYTDAIHTFVTIRAAKKGKPRPSNPVSPEIRGKAAEYFTLKAFPGDGKVLLEWTPPQNTSNVIGYNLYRNTSRIPYGSPITDFPIKGLSHTDHNVDNGVKACYYMTAVYSDKSESSRSNEVCVTPGDSKITIVLTIASKNAYVNQQLVVLDVAPFIDSGRTFVPFRFVGESLGAEVGYTTNSSGRVATVTYKVGSTSIILYIGKKEATVNGRTVYLDVAPQIVQGRTVIPLRFVTEALGCKVDWDGQKMQVTIEYPA